MRVWLLQQMDQSVLKDERVLTTDPGMGVARHVDAGYDIAIQTAKEKVFIFQ